MKLRFSLFAFPVGFIVLLAFAVGLAGTADGAENWLQFRGAEAGRVAKIQHPLAWSAESNIAWKIPMKGSGWSSPIVVGDRVFLTSAVAADGRRPKGMMAGVASMRSYRSAKPIEYRFVVQCFNLKDGAELWQRDTGKATPAVIHPSNTYATESPASDGERFYSFFAATGTLTAWSLDGKSLWTKQLGSYKSGNGFGSGSSLTVHGGNLFVQFDNDEKSFVAAFDCASGDQVWRDDRKTKTSWSTPVLWSTDTSTQLVTCGAGVVTSYEPGSGKVLWSLDGMQSAFSGSPGFDANCVFFGNSGPMSAGPLVAVPKETQGEVNLDADFQAEQLAWSRTKSGPGMASPLVIKDRIYIPGRGVLNCYDVASGERVYRSRLEKLGTVAASLWGDNDRVFILDENGSTFVVRTGDTMKVEATNKLPELVWSTPAIARDALLIRGVEHLYCIRNK